MSGVADLFDFPRLGSGIASDKFGILLQKPRAGFTLEQGHAKRLRAASARCTRLSGEMIKRDGKGDYALWRDGGA